MKKILLLVFLCLTTIAVSASPDITCSSDGKRYTFTGVDYVFMFSSITPATTTITYNGPYVDINSITWSKFTNGTSTTFSTGQSSISPDDATGYTLTVDGVKIADIWVIDYNNYKPVLTGITALDNADKCSYVDLLINAKIPTLSYQTPGGLTKPITRNFEINYTTLSWGGTTWQDSTATVKLTSPISNSYTVKVPYKATTFTLSGDQYANDLGITVTPAVSNLYTFLAVICHETSIVVTRNATNEAERPTSAKQVTGSAPLDMTFYSNPNDPVLYYNWQIFKDKSKTSLISGRIEKTTPYTFDEAGSYVVKVTVSNANATCSYSDSITVTVSTSSIEAPNVFTPNGDGHNDEFRVAYKSIIQFDAWVYNRWGRLVYKWSDPMKGWDGNIGGKKAAAGAYFYVIKAVGADGKKYKLKGDINLLR
jgi:gliding motility-associated-like protein